MKLKYKQYAKMLYKIAWSYHKTTGIEFDDLAGEANLAFCKAQKIFTGPTEDFNAYLSASTNNALRSYIKKQFGFL